jgi:DNA modification methylase
VKPYYSDAYVTLYHGDCREVLPSLAFDAVLTDPPYGIDYDTNSQRFTRRASPWWHNVDSSLVSNKPRVSGDRKPFDPAPLIHVPAVLWGANHYADRLPTSGGWLVWDKRLGAEDMAEKGWPLSEAELAWTNVRGSIRVYRNLWAGLLRSAEKGEHYHPTQKPLDLMRWCLGFLPEGVVCDPYVGSGTTLRAAKDLGRKAIGIEIEERYCEIAARRMAQEVLALA